MRVVHTLCLLFFAQKHSDLNLFDPIFLTKSFCLSVISCSTAWLRLTAPPAFSDYFKFLSVSIPVHPWLKLFPLCSLRSLRLFQVPSALNLFDPIFLTKSFCLPVISCSTAWLRLTAL